MGGPIDDLYQRAKLGAWDLVLAAWARDESLAAACAHYATPSSGWTFLHQAAHHGQEPACRRLIGLGASLDAEGHDRLRPVGVARRRGHPLVAGMLEHAASGARPPLWAPPEEPGVRPSSCLWSEATPRTAAHEFPVAYAGTTTAVRAGCTYYVDSFDRVLVGWHGTTSPPRGMDGDSMVDAE